MPGLRIAQLASYRGNIGDQANVVGTRRLLAENLQRPLEFSDLEYLEYEPDPRWGGRKFDDAFVRIANQHDLLMIGGGGFFELAVDRSATGTPIDLAIETLDRIDVPVVFYSLGFDTSAGVTPPRVAKFRAFIEHALERPRTLVSVRNDGSRAGLVVHLGEAIARRIDVVPDGGFFTHAPRSVHPELPPGKRSIAVNIAGDGLGFRFGDPRGSEENFNRFLTGLAGVLKDLFRDPASGGIHVVLMPHIPEDLPVAWQLMEKIGPPEMRRSVTVAPYLLGRAGQDYMFDLYRACDMVVGMRFHANVVPIGLGVPVIGLVTHPQIANLYDELGMPQRALRVAEEDFAPRLRAMIDEGLAEGPAIRARYAKLCRGLRSQVDAFHRKIAVLVGASREAISA